MITHLQPFDYWLWAIEFTIQLGIFIVSFRRCLFLLSGYAVSRIAFDILTYFTLANSDRYEYGFWILKPLEYLFQIIFGLDCVAKILRDGRTYVRLIFLGLATSATAGIVAAYFLGPFRNERLLNIETTVNFVVTGGVFLAVLMGKPTRIYRLLAYGLIALSLSDALLGMITPYFKQYWDIIARAYPISEIAALGLMLVAPLYRSRLLRIGEGTERETRFVPVWQPEVKGKFIM